MDKEIKASLEQLSNCADYHALLIFFNKNFSWFTPSSDFSQQFPKYWLVISQLIDMTCQWQQHSLQALEYQSQQDRLANLKAKIIQEEALLLQQQTQLTIQTNKNTILYQNILSSYNHYLRKSNEGAVYTYIDSQPLSLVEEYQQSLTKSLRGLNKVKSRIQFTQLSHQQDTALAQYRQQFNSVVDLQKLLSLNIFSQDCSENNFLMQLKDLHTYVAFKYYKEQVHAINLERQTLQATIDKHQNSIFSRYRKKKLQPLEQKKQTLIIATKHFEQQLENIPPISGKISKNIAVYQQAKLLLNKLDIELSDNCNKVLLENLQLAIQKYQALNKIHKNACAINALKTTFIQQYSEFLPDRFILPSKQVTILSTKEKIEERQKLIEEYEQTLNKCFEYYQELKLLNNHQTSQKKLIKATKKLQKEIQVLEEIFNSEEYHQFFSKKIQLEQNIDEKLTQLKGLILTDSVLLDSKDDLQVTLESSKDLDKWQQAINSIDVWIPNDLKAWYDQLAQALNQQVLANSPYFYQAQQLLRDIHFEMRYGSINKDYPILRAYRADCLNPSIDWQRLLDKRLPVKLVLDDSACLSSINNIRIANIIKNLQAIQTKLPLDSKQALLLEQLRTNLYYSYHLIQENKLTDPQWLQTFSDPRYDCLYQHSNLIQKWIAEVVKCFITLLHLKSAQNPNSFWNKMQHNPSGQTIMEIKAALEELIISV